MLFKHTLISCLALTGMALAAFPAQAAPFLPVPPASFLNYRVSTARGLSEQVAHDVVVRARLARHFGMSAPALTAYVRANLVESTLSAKQAGRYRVACVGPSGREYFVSERLAAGTPVFVLSATGQPVLKLACGNPLVAALPPAPPRPVAKAKPVAKVKPALLASSPKAATPEIVPPVAAPSRKAADWKFLPETPLAAPTTGAVGPSVQVAGATQGLSRGKGALLPVLIGGAGVGVLASHHDSAPPPVSAPPAAVPEPNPLLLLGIFGTAVLGFRLKNRLRQG